MRKFFTTLTTVATVTLAAVPALGLLQAAHAAEPTARIAIGDLRDPAQAAEFLARVDAQGDTLCRQIAGRHGASGLRQDDCVTQVRLQARRQLTSAQRADLRHSAATTVTMVASR